MHGLAVYVKEGLPFAWDLSLENSADSYLCFRLALLHSVSYFFFLYRSPSSSLCMVFDSISSNIDEVLLINSSANVFVFGDFDALFHNIAYDYSHADWDGLCDHLRDVPWEDIFKLSASAAASEFCEWVQVGIDVYILHRKYQVKSHSSPWFSAACAAAIVHRNHFFVCTKRINLLNLK